MVRSDLVIISDIAVDEAGVALSLKSKSGRPFFLKLGPRLEILSALNDGHPFPVLSNGLPTSPEHLGFVLPFLGTVDSPHGKLEAFICSRGYMATNVPYLPRGKLEALVCSRSYVATNVPYAQVECARAKAVVQAGTGDLWMGPFECRVVVLDNRMLGVTVNQYRDLWVFAPPRARIPLPPEGVERFRQEVVRFETEFQADRYQWKPDLTVNVRDLFPGDARFGGKSEFSLWSVTVREKSLVLRLSSGNPQAYPEVVLDSDLKVLSARVPAWDSPDRLPPNAPRRTVR
jgi:hypothetical protein